MIARMAHAPRTVGSACRAAVLPLLFAGALLWLTALVAAPVVVGRVDPAHPAFQAASAMYLAGAVVCHQRGERSLHAGSVRLPVCGRCIGIYAGAVLGLAAAMAWPRRCARALVDRWTARRRWPWALAAAAVPAAVLWLIEWTGTLTTAAANPARAVTGVVLGAGVAWTVGMTVRAWLAPR